MKRAALILAVLAGGCAWADRDNRPLWNAFEANLVPEGSGAFVATLPLTVPIGLGAIVLDTLVAHPIQVMDDAWDDAAWLWRDGRPDFAGRYYSELAFLPLRTAITPVTFACSFLGRSLFRFSGRTDDAERAAAQAERDAKAAADVRAWLAALEAGDVQPFGGRTPRSEESFAADFARALGTVNALARLELYRAAVGHAWAESVLDLRLALRDPDPVVRFHALEWVGRRAEVAPQLIERLREDPVEAVRLRARARWPQ